MNSDNQKIFLIINLSCFGDVLLTNTLCQNLKIEYPDCKVVFLVNEPYIEAAKYQEGVDDVIFINKRKQHKSLWGLLKFASECKYKNKIYASFIIYGNSRGIIISKLLNSKLRISGPTKIFKHLLTNIHYYDPEKLLHMQDINGDFIRALTNKEAKILPVKYNAPPLTDDILIKKLKEDYKNQTIIAICAVTEEIQKNMPVKTTAEIIDKLSKENKTVFFLGVGTETRLYADNLKKQGCTKFVDLTNITCIAELSAILCFVNGIITVDTGTMHLANAVKCPSVCCFYKKENVVRWAPKNSLYPAIVIDDDFSASNILDKLYEIIR